MSRSLARQLWDLRNTGTPLREYTGHTQDTTACVFLETPRRGVRSDGGGKDDGGGGEESDGFGRTAPDSASRGIMMIATASKDETIKIYDRESGALSVSRPELKATMYVPGTGGSRWTDDVMWRPENVCLSFAFLGRSSARHERVFVRNETHPPSVLPPPYLAESGCVQTSYVCISWLASPQVGYACSLASNPERAHFFLGVFGEWPCLLLVSNRWPVDVNESREVGL